MAHSAPKEQQARRGSAPRHQHGFLRPAHKTCTCGGGGGGGDAGGAKPLPDRLRQRMERAFGADLEHVRVRVSQQPRRMGAVAFARGSQIHVAPGRYQPHSLRGQRVLGHEVAHVVQQARGRVARPSLAEPVNRDAGLEAEADRAGERAALGGRVALRGGRAAGGPAQARGLAARGAPVQCLYEYDHANQWFRRTDPTEPTPFGHPGHYTDVSTSKALHKLASWSSSPLPSSMFSTSSSSSSTSSKAKGKAPASKPPPQRKQINWRTSRALRFARARRLEESPKKSTGINYATARLRMEDAKGKEKVRYLTMASGEGTHSEGHLIEGIAQIRKAEAVKKRKLSVDQIASDLEDCGKDNQNCNRKVFEQLGPSTRYFFGLPYSDRRAYPKGRSDDSHLSPAARKKQRRAAVNKLKRLHTHARKNPKTFQKKMKTDKDYPELEFDSDSDTDSDSEYETDLEEDDF